MYKTKLCLGTNEEFGIPLEEQIRCFKRVGFDAFFTGWCAEIKHYKKIADEIGMIYQSVHAPYLNAAKMWKSDDESKWAVDELVRCVRDCAEAEIPLMVAHTYIGFEQNEEPTLAGLDNFGQVVEEAEKLHVKIAFENTEGEAYLSALMQAFSHKKHVGFCWDTGHELCYNRGKDMLALYGDRLMATHINDNLGVSRFDGEIFWTDDLHLLPFDGIGDWKHVAKRLRQCGYDDILTFELNKKSKPHRHDNDKYEKMSTEEYLAECYARACRFAYMKDSEQV